MTPLTVNVHDRAEPEAIATAMAVMASAFDPRFGEAWTESQLRSMLTMPGALLVTGRIGKAPAGFGLIRVIAPEAELLLLAVHPDFRNMGHGRRILDRCLTAAEQRGVETVFLEARSGNPAVHLYFKSGFHQYSERKNYYAGKDGECFDALSLRLFLKRL